ncbi:MAG: hypothetical protein DSM107014_01965 [Gomphosphaeria aponina SAG 52.96 = DSM 107014]|uniref:Double-GTPase 1 domain-containing protein n=1 Tax=Gomphosphaeria aponina SAG 52.96 = DSM 107014 TaxID=1521640 RepID=A0A941GPI5_9CHRO|nr:hypothetical protein [Gomphosphaeria aponina SAG 52.96 = DSM 107014]
MSEIRVIGPRGSGKTTYLATIAYLGELARTGEQEHFKGLKVTAIGPDSEKLVGLAKDVIKQGQKVPPTRTKGNIEYHPDYQLEINIPGGGGKRIELVAKDYPGEVFELLGLRHKLSEIESYLEDLFTTNHWLIMLTDWQTDQDTRVYQPAFDSLLDRLEAETKNKSELANIRIAVVMAKCERGELWPGRLEPEQDLFKIRLPLSHDILRKKFPSSKQLKFFACSSFGVMGDKDPRPNRYLPNDGSSAENAYLRKGDCWQPYGLLSPLYWLDTGKILKDVRL